MRRVLLGIILFLGVVQEPSWALLSASDLVGRARTLLKDTSVSANRQQFSDAQYLQWASDGQREANAQNWLLQSTTSFPLLAGVTNYVLPTDFMFPTRVLYQQPGQPFVKLPATSLNDLDAKAPGWFNVSGTPINYYLNALYANYPRIDLASNQAEYIEFYPAPTTGSTGTVNVDYVQSVQDMTTTSQNPFNGVVQLQPYVSALPYYMAYRAYLVLEEDALAKEYLSYWGNFLLIMRQGVNRQPDFNPPAGALRSGSPSSQGALGSP